MVLPIAAIALNSVQRTQAMHESDHTWTRRSLSLPSWSAKKASDMEILLDGEPQFIRSFTTFDEITGHVRFKFHKDTSIDDFAIMFHGQTNTYIEKLATTSPTMGRTTGKHTFLRVQQPIDERHVPENNLALAGVTYTIPFKFVVPDRLLDFACSHKVEQSCVRDAHLLLPPSIGEPMLSGQGNTLMDDLAPNMSKIVYSIQAKLSKACASTGKLELIEEDLRVRIVPAREELPPLSIDLMPKAAAGKYALRKEKIVRKGLFNIGKKQGHLTAETLQPASLKLPHPSQDMSEPAATMTTIRLRFDPVSADEAPPALHNIVSKLKVYTFFGAAPWKHFPTPDGYDIYSTLHSQYPISIDLSSRNLSNIDWTKHKPESPSTNPSSAANKKPTSHGRERRQSKSTCVSVPSNSSMSTKGSHSMADDLLSRRASIFSTASSSSDTTPSDSASSESESAASSSLHLPRTGSIPTPSTVYTASLPYYTTSIVVPITLPTASSSSAATSAAASPSQSRRSSAVPGDLSQPQSTHTANKASKPRRSKPVAFLPTFHSCLVCRIYTLELSVNMQSTPTVNLRVPVQVSLPHYNADPTYSSDLRSSTPPPTPWRNPFRSDNNDDTTASNVFPASAATNATHVNLRDDDNEEGGQDQQDIQNDEDLVRTLAREQFLRNYRRHTLGDVPEYEDTYRVVGREGGGGDVGDGRSGGNVDNGGGGVDNNDNSNNTAVVAAVAVAGAVTAGTLTRNTEAPPEYHRTIRRASTTDVQRRRTTAVPTTAAAGASAARGAPSSVHHISNNNNNNSSSSRNFIGSRNRGNKRVGDERRRFSFMS